MIHLLLSSSHFVLFGHFSSLIHPFSMPPIPQHTHTHTHTQALFLTMIVKNAYNQELLFNKNNLKLLRLLLHTSPVVILLLHIYTEYLQDSPYSAMCSIINCNTYYSAIRSYWYSYVCLKHVKYILKEIFVNMIVRIIN